MLRAPKLRLIAESSIVFNNVNLDFWPLMTIPVYQISLTMESTTPTSQYNMKMWLNAPYICEVKYGDFYVLILLGRLT